MLATTLPTRAEDLSVDVLNRVMASWVPGASLTSFEVVETHVWGSGQVSSAGRIVIKPTYANDTPTGLPNHIVIKVAKTLPDDPATPNPIAGGGGALYSNEVNVYAKLKPSTFMEAPVSLGGAYDAATNSMLLLLEDLRDRGVSFASVIVPTSLERMRSLLDQLALLHARYWNNAELKALSWLQTHTTGSISMVFNTPAAAPKFIAQQIASEQFKREMVERLGSNVDELFRNFQLVQQHQARLAQTVCHGDTHIGNTYILPDDRGSLLDWQLTSQGYAMHDVSYLIASGLTIEARRAHERELLAYYRQQLLSRGTLDVPSQEDFWTEYRRAMIWGVYIGWLTTPTINYGWEITVLNHLRMMTAYEDLDTGQLISNLR
jgi:hypothetical protein